MMIYQGTRWSGRFRGHSFGQSDARGDSVGPSSRESTSDSDDGREWSVVPHGRANGRASTSDAVRVSPALNAVDKGRFAVLAEERVRARECGSESRKPPLSRRQFWRLRIHGMCGPQPHDGSITTEKVEVDMECPRSGVCQSSRHQGSIKSLRAIGRPNWCHSSRRRVAQSFPPACGALSMRTGWQRLAKHAQRRCPPEKIGATRNESIGSWSTANDAI